MTDIEFLELVKLRCGAAMDAVATDPTVSEDERGYRMDRAAWTELRAIHRDVFGPPPALSPVRQAMMDVYAAGMPDWKAIFDWPK